MKRKLLSVLLVLAMVLAILPVGAMAAEEKSKGEFTYTIGYWAWGPEATITGYTDLDVTDLVIPEIAAKYTDYNLPDMICLGDYVK